MSRRGIIFSILGLMLVVGAGVGGSWYAKRTFLAKDEIRVRVHLPLLDHLTKTDMPATLTGKSGIAEVTMPRYRLPGWIVQYPLRPAQMKRHGVNEAAILAAMQRIIDKSRLRTRTEIGVADYKPRPRGRAKAGRIVPRKTQRRISVEIKGSEPTPPALYEAVRTLAIMTPGGPVRLASVTDRPIVLLGTIVSSTETILVRLGDRWHYPEAREALTAYLKAKAAAAPELPRHFNIPPPRDRRAYRIME